MAFEIALWSKGAVRILVVCEEAHRYVPADSSLGFFPTRQAIARIAKEGRKYGVSLGIITQRPGELDQTILSQCSTIFSLRLANDRDQEIIGKALPDSSASSLSFISSLANGEAIAFGEAVPVPMRLKFSRVQESVLPAAHGADAQESSLDPNSINLASVVERMRSTSGPDISDFQSRVFAAEASIFDAVTSGVSDAVRDMDIPAHDHTRASPPLDPYVPGTLPGQARFDSTQAGGRENRIDRYSRFSGEPGHSEPPGFSPRPTSGDTLQTRREGLLRKPLDSLLKR
jgi:hypothetical protein